MRNDFPKLELPRRSVRQLGIDPVVHGRADELLVFAGVSSFSRRPC